MAQHKKHVVYRLHNGLKVATVSRYSKKKTLVIGIFLMLFVVGIFAILMAPSVGSPAKRSSISGSSKSTVAEPKIESTVPSEVSNNYFRLQLPTGYRQQSAGQGTSGALYQQTIIKSSVSGSQLIAISVFPLSSGSLQELSAYQLRTQMTAQYTKSQKTISSEPVEVFNDTRSASTVIFWKHGGYVATIAASSAIQDLSIDGNSAQLEALQPLLDSWQWQ